MKKILSIILGSVLISTAAFATLPSVWTFAQDSGANKLSSATFIAYYKGDDTYIQTEDSWGSKDDNDEGFFSLVSVCQVNPDDMNYSQSWVNSSSSFDIWVASGSEGGHASLSALGNSDPVYASPNPLVLSANNLATPANFKAQGSPTSIALSWDKVANASGYTIYRRPATLNPGKFIYEKITEESASTLYYEDKQNLNSGTTYYYIIVAKNSTQRSAHSSEQSAQATTSSQPISKVVITPPQASLEDGDTKKFTAQAYGYSKAISNGVTYSWTTTGSKNTINSSSGLFTAGSDKGKYTITVTAKTSTDQKTAVATAEIVELSSIAVAPQTLSLKANQTFTFSIEATYSNNVKKYINSGVSYSIVGAPTAVGTVDASSGKFYAHKQGSCQLTAGYGGKSATANITVTADLQSIIVNPAGPINLQSGGTKTFTLKAKYTDSSEQTLNVNQATWSVSDQDKGTFDSNSGVFTAKKQGSCVLKASYGGKDALVNITIGVGAAANLYINSTQDQVQAGSSLTLTATAEDSQGNAVFPITPIWSTSAGQISSSGVLIAPQQIDANNKIITVVATLPGASAQKSINLVAAAPNYVQLTSSQDKVEVGQTLSFTAKAFDTYNNPVEAKAFSWKTSAGTISATGVLTAPNKTQDLQVTVTYPQNTSITDFKIVDVVAGALASAKISPTSPKVEAGDIIDLTVAGFDKFSNEITKETWTYVASTQAGTYPISKEFIYNGVKKIATENLTIYAAAAQSIVVSPASVILEVGDSQTFTATAYDKFGNKVTNITFQYISPFGNSNTVIPSQDGNFQLEAKYNQISGSANIKVIPKIKEIKFASQAYSADKNAQNPSIEVYPYAVDQSGQPVDLSGFALSFEVTGTENGNSVDPYGRFKPGSKEGAYTLTATLKTKSNTYTAKTTVHVNLGGPTITATVNDNSLKDGMILDEKPKIKIDAQDSNGVKSVNLSIDGKNAHSSDIKSSSVTSSQIVATFSPTDKIASGTHTLVIEAQDSLGSTSQITVNNVKVFSDLRITNTPMNYPNPFKPSVGTTINYILSKDADIRLYIYDLAQRLIYSAEYSAGSNGGQAGENDVTWNGQNAFGEKVANGVYLYFIINRADNKVLGSGEISAYQ